LICLGLGASLGDITALAVALTVLVPSLMLDDGVLTYTVFLARIVSEKMSSRPRLLSELNEI